MPEIWCSTCKAHVNPEQTTEGLYCGECGEELGSHFEETVEFNENHTMVGRFVSSERAMASAATALAGVPQFSYDENGNLIFTSAVPQAGNTEKPMTESRLQTIEKAKRRISVIALLMKIPNHYVDRATNTYKLALLKGSTKARNPDIVAAACLYFVLRQDKQPYMLMDFSESMKTDVFLIGHCFLDLMTALNFKLPAVEPFFYVRRFANRLLLNSGKENANQEAINRVIQTTLKLIASMKRNWIQTGRRPAGICAAALLVAARIHGFKNISKQDVVKVVKICTATLTKRLMEFDKTETAQLSPEEFERREQEINNGSFQGTIDVSDPPAYSRSLKEKSKLMERYEPEQKDLERGTDVNDQDVEEAEKLIQDKEIEEISTELEKGDQLARAQRLQESQSKPIPDTTLPSSSLPSASQDVRQTQIKSSEFEDDESISYEESNNHSKISIENQTEQQNQIEEDEEEEIDTLSDFEDDSEIEEIVITEESEIEGREKLWDELHLEYLQAMEENRKEREERKKRGGGRRKRNNTNVDASSSVFNMGGLIYGASNSNQPETHAVFRSASEASANLLRAKIARNLVSKSLFDEDELLSDTMTIPQSNADVDNNLLGKRKPLSIQEKNRYEYKNDEEYEDDFVDDFEGDYEKQPKKFKFKKK
ncbi:transcription factor [Naegleria gruberi]|uniref:Transcription factor n=1 Tax=Naegleria gruberi TaxID=5762 RepID=D2UXP3_NAEGR|nr:transcription factor [Naegleria gruberi]EFC50320.1 transcription factor [Naegleria gruberi]|eukprot:XP_002683064.1 transcription factor [Naegleria gruberi strain NEG-M]